jgi:HEXXH motif-containing protein
VDPPLDLTLPAPGSGTLRRVYGEYLKSTLQSMLRLPLGRFDNAVADAFFRVQKLMRGLLRERDARRAGAVFSVIRRPNVSALVRCIEHELRGRGDVDLLDTWLEELSATVGWELWAAGALPESGLELGRHPARVLCLGRRLEIRAGGVEQVRWSTDSVSFLRATRWSTLDLDTLSLEPGQDRDLGEGLLASRPFHEIAGDLVLALADNNPLSGVEAHPDKSGNAIDLGEATASDWVANLRGALELISRHLPDLSAEISMLMQLLVPVGTFADKHVSASYAEVVGTAYLSLHPDPMTMAEAIVHEFSHNKLNALLSIEPVLDNAHSAGHASPVRPDRRPLLGVLLAAHAFIPVARLYEQMLASGDPLAGRSGFVERYHEIVAGNHDAIDTLRRLGKPTAGGAHLLSELSRWDAHFREAVSTAAPAS